MVDVPTLPILKFWKIRFVLDKPFQTFAVCKSPMKMFHVSSSIFGIPLCVCPRCVHFHQNILKTLKEACPVLILTNELITESQVS